MSAAERKHARLEMETSHTNQELDYESQKIECLQIAAEILTRWKRVGTSQGLNSDSRIANFLLRFFEARETGHMTVECCSVCQTSLILSCPNCEKNQRQNKTDQLQDFLWESALLPARERHQNKEFQEENGVQKEERLKQTEEFNEGYLKNSHDTLVFDKIHPETQDSQKEENCPEWGTKDRHSDCGCDSEDNRQPAKSVRNQRRKADSLAKHQSGTSLQRKLATPKSKGLAVKSQIQRFKHKHICPHCSQVYKYRASFNSHLRQHGDVNLFKCVSCQQHFSSSTVLEQHALQHPDQQDFACGACRKKFQELHLLSVHVEKLCQKVHAFSCLECEETFLFWSDLKAHSVTHCEDQQHIHHVSRDGLQIKLSSAIPAKQFRGKVPINKSRKIASNAQKKAKEICIPVSCPECGTMVSRARDLKIHMRVHTGEMPYKCSDCKKPFRHRASYRLHIRHKCDGKLYADNEHRMRSKAFVQRTKDDTRPLDLEWKDITCVNLSGECDNLNNITDAGLITEPKNVILLEKSLNHLNAQFQQEDRNQFICQQETDLDQNSLQNDMSDLQQDRQLAHQPHSYIWNEQHSLLESSIQISSEMPSLNCLEKVTHKVEQNDTQQLLSHRPPGRRPFNPNACVACEVCGMKISRQRDLKIHMRIHSGEKPYLCSECGEEFRQAAGLFAHNIRKHSGQRPYVCDQCGASFPLVGSLNQHMRIHDGLKPYTCQQCDKAFLRFTDLKGHIARHLGIKKFSCEDCGKMFSTSSEVAKHKSLHTGTKPHICLECRKAFRLKKSLKVHLRIHFNGKPSHPTDGQLASSLESYAAQRQLLPEFLQ